MRHRIARAVLVGLSLVSLALLGVLAYPFAGALLFGAVLAGSFLSMVDRLTLRVGGSRPLAAGLTTAVVAGVTDNIVKPLLMRNRTEVHSAVIFFSLIGGLAAFGMAGLVAGPLIVSFFLTIVRMCRRDLYELDSEAGRVRAEYRPRTA